MSKKRSIGRMLLHGLNLHKVPLSLCRTEASMLSDTLLLIKEFQLREFVTRAMQMSLAIGVSKAPRLLVTPPMVVPTALSWTSVVRCAGL